MTGSWSEDDMVEGAPDASEDASALERRYRGMLHLLPRSYRADRGEEMLGTLMDGAGEGQRWPRPAEAASLIGLALRERLGTPAPDRLKDAANPLLRAMAMIGSASLALGGLSALMVFVEYRDGVPYPNWTDSGFTGGRVMLGTLILPVLWVAVFAALIAGFHRMARFTALATILASVFVPHEPGQTPTPISMGVVTTLAILTAFGASAERVRYRKWWMLLLAGMTVMAAVEETRPQNQGLIYVVELAVLLLIAVIPVARAHRHPEWPMAFALLNLSLFAQPTEGSPLLVAFFVAVTLYALIAKRVIAKRRKTREARADYTT